ncbi:hypothetical protein MMC19_003857 [Ptychographa xylographoides]|nr:hypothetical protein [Ptychographa xylographoides]
MAASMEVLHEPCTRLITGKGYIKGLKIIDSSSGNIKCYRFGGLPYAIPITSASRWTRAQPLPEDFQYGTEDDPTDFTGLSAECPQSKELESPASTEDCLQCNIWIPAGDAPTGGWPVWVYIRKCHPSPSQPDPQYSTPSHPDGGFLQWGSPNREDPSELLAQTAVRCIIVAPTYRLNVFGFLASHELQQEACLTGSTYGNLGFWDQRTALEWTAAHIARFAGNEHNITLGGLSAGAYSTFHQLAHDLEQPPSRALIRRVMLWSNGAGLPPKALPELQPHFDALLAALAIPLSLPGPHKLARLRALPADTLLAALRHIPTNAFRAVCDGVFIRPTLFPALDSGRFGARMRARNITVLLGDVRDEHTAYALVQPPSSYATLIARLAVEYPVAAAHRLAALYCPTGALPAGRRSWTDAFGRLYADMQVHVSQRGLVAALARTLPAGSIWRYRIEWRAACVDAYAGREMGVCHGSDLAVWFYGNGARLGEGEKVLVRSWLVPVGRFLNGGVEGEEEGEGGWGTQGVEEVRVLGADGRIVVRRDGEWERCLGVWGALGMGMGMGRGGAGGERL